jgi:hypothetical protein
MCEALGFGRSPYTKFEGLASRPTRENGELLPPVDMVGFKIVVVNSQDQAEALAGGEMYECGVGEVHGAVGIVVHESLDLRQFLVRNRRHLNRARAQESPNSANIAKASFGEMKNFRLGLPTSADRFSRFFIRRPPSFGLALVPELLAFGQSQFHLDPAVLKVQPRRDQGQALLLGLADQLANLFAMHQQLAGAQRGVVEDVAVLVGTDVGVQQPDRIVFDQAVGVLKIGEAAPDGLDLGPGEDHPGLKFFQQEVVM